MFQGFQYLAAAGQQDLAIPSVQIRENLRFALASLVGRGRCSYLRVQFEPGRLQHFFEKLAKSRGSAFAVQFSVVYEIFAHETPARPVWASTLSAARLLLCARGFDRGGKRVSPVQVPLLQNTYQAASENIQRQAARERKNNKHDGKGDGHELHHLGLLGLG